MITHIALVPHQIDVPSSTLTAVAAALQRQVVGDFGPHWNVDATVSAFTDWSSVPADYVRIALIDGLGSGAAGVHRASNGQPYALVDAHGAWSIVASHECLEMLADPSGSKTLTGPPPSGHSTSNVEFLLEVCDPVQGRESSYAIDGVQVSNFCLPRYYDGVGGAGEQWAFRGNLPGPRELMKGGYVVWHDTVAKTWWRRDWFGDDVTDDNLGAIEPGTSFLRSAIDARVRTQRRARHPGATPRGGLRLPVDRHARAKAKALADDIAAALATHQHATPFRKAKRT